MSNVDTNLIEQGSVLYPESLPTTLPEGFEPPVHEPVEETTETTETTPAPKKKKNVVYRLFAPLLAIASILVFFLVKLEFFAIGAPKMKAFDVVKELKNLPEKLFGVLPALSKDIVAMDVATVSFYAFLLFLAIGVLFGILTVFTSKKAPAMFAITCFFFTSAWCAHVVGGDALYYVATGKHVKDWIAVALAGVGVLLWLVFAIAKKGGKAFGNFLQFIVTLGVTAVMLGSYVKYPVEFVAGVDKLPSFLTLKIVGLTLVGFMAFTTLFAALRMRWKKGLRFDMFRLVLQFILSAVVCYIAIATPEKSNKFLIVAIATAVVTLFQIIFTAVAIKKAKPAKETAPVVEEPAPVEETKEEENEEFVVEEFAEAVPYEGGPVCGVAMAEVVEETPVEEPAPIELADDEPAPAPVVEQPVQTAGYDFYNSRSFDPFIATLSNEERNQFTELFIVRYKGVMPEIPDYQVGGDNKTFFKKVFIYLGQYRDRIPDGLLAKMYEFAVKM